MDIPKVQPVTLEAAQSSSDNFISPPPSASPMVTYSTRYYQGETNLVSSNSNTPSNTGAHGNHGVLVTDGTSAVFSPIQRASSPKRIPSSPSSGSGSPHTPPSPPRKPDIPDSGLQRQHVSCRGLLLARREVIIRRMTEGRLNHLLDVLRSRDALSREAYENISAAVTLAARTRSLLDICYLLGERVAALVAFTLGLVSVSNKGARA